MLRCLDEASNSVAYNYAYAGNHLQAWATFSVCRKTDCFPNDVPDS